jgi:hypothetical protein
VVGRERGHVGAVVGKIEVGREGSATCALSCSDQEKTRTQSHSGTVSRVTVAL